MGCSSLLLYICIVVLQLYSFEHAKSSSRHCGVSQQLVTIGERKLVRREVTLPKPNAAIAPGIRPKLAWGGWRKARWHIAPALPAEFRCARHRGQLPAGVAGVRKGSPGLRCIPAL